MGYSHSRAPWDNVSTVAREFERRSIVYGGIDARLRPKTRFFAAACVTNRVLAQLVALKSGSTFSAGLPVGAPVSVPCTTWLADLGAVLERTNLNVAAAVSTGSLAGPALDARLVSLEQSVVQEALLVSIPAPIARFSCIELELDGLLNPHWIASVHLCPVVRWYSRVLRTVRRELQAPLQFSQQSHREKIGVALIASLSRERGRASII